MSDVPEVVLDLRQHQGSIADALANCAEVPSAIVLKGMALDAAALAALDEFVHDSYGAPLDRSFAAAGSAGSASATAGSAVSADDASSGGGSVGSPMPPLGLLDLRGVRAKVHTVYQGDWGLGLWRGLLPS